MNCRKDDVLRLLRRRLHRQEYGSGRYWKADRLWPNFKRRAESIHSGDYLRHQHNTGEESQMGSAKPDVPILVSVPESLVCQSGRPIRRDFEYGICQLALYATRSYG